MEKRKEVVLSDFDRLCEPREALSTVRAATQWELVPYETADGYKGSMLASLKGGTPPAVTVSPGL